MVWVHHETRSVSWLHPLGVFVMVTGLGHLCHEAWLVGWLQVLHVFVMVTCFECLSRNQVSQFVTSLGCASVHLAVTCHQHFWQSDQDLCDCGGTGVERILK